MIRLTSVVLAATLVAAGATSAFAQGYGHGPRPVADETDARQVRQAHRIEQGARDGSLTAREAAGLLEQQRQIAEYERRAKADGVVDPNERANLRNLQNQASRTIDQERDDMERRNAVFGAPAWRPWWRSWW